MPAGAYSWTAAMQEKTLDPFILHENTGVHHDFRSAEEEWKTAGRERILSLSSQLSFFLPKAQRQDSGRSVLDRVEDGGVTSEQVDKRSIHR
jgi:hypothetical protein